VDEYLLGQNLVLRDTLLPDPPPAVALPSHLAGNARKQFEAYLLNAPHKAFAMSPSGAFGCSYGWRTIADAEVRALENCAKYSVGGIPCTIAMIVRHPRGPNVRQPCDTFLEATPGVPLGPHTRTLKPKADRRASAVRF
jgi:hypothetical protein